MKFKHKLIPAMLCKRYKRFLADVKLKNGKIITIHCPNPGAMLGLQTPNSKCWISKSDNKNRKYPHTLEIVETQKVKVGINTNLANTLAREAIEQNKIPAIANYKNIQAEVPYGTNSRIDFLLDEKCYVEVKNVHLLRTPNIAEFPDCKTARGTKHLGELTKIAKQGKRAILLYIIQRQDCQKMKIANDLDPTYSQAFKKALANGVESYAINCKISVEKISTNDIIEIIFN